MLRLSLVLAMSFAAIAGATPPPVSIRAECAGEQVVLHLNGVHPGPQYTDTWAGLRVYARIDGACGDLRLVNAELLPWPGSTDLVDDLATRGIASIYVTRAVDDAGVEHPTGGNGWTSAIAGCGDWVLSRGTLNLGAAWQQGILELEPCADTCWFEPLTLDVSALPPAEYLPLIGRVVDVRGAAWVDEMPGTAGATVTSLSTAVDGCGPAVGNRIMSWDAVETLYR